MEYSFSRDTSPDRITINGKVDAPPSDYRLFDDDSEGRLIVKREDGGLMVSIFPASDTVTINGSAFTGTTPSALKAQLLTDIFSANSGSGGSGGGVFDVTSDGLSISSPAPNSSTGVGYNFDTDNELIDAAALLAQFKNKGIPILFIGRNGGMLMGQKVISSGWDFSGFPGITILKDESVGETDGAAIDIAATDDYSNINRIFSFITHVVKTSTAYINLQYKNADYEQRSELNAGPDNSDDLTYLLTHAPTTGEPCLLKITLNDDGVLIESKKGSAFPQPTIWSIDSDGGISTQGGIRADQGAYFPGGFIEANPKISGNGVFAGTDTTVDITVEGGGVNDMYVLTPKGSVITANDILSVVADTGKFTAYRPSGGTPDLQFNYIRIVP